MDDPAEITGLMSRIEQERGVIVYFEDPWKFPSRKSKARWGEGLAAGELRNLLEAGNLILTDQERNASLYQLPTDSRR